MNGKGIIHRVETWLLEDGKMHRPTSKERISFVAYVKQQQPGVEYTVYKWVPESRSSSSGDVSPWQKVKINIVPGKLAEAQGTA